MSGPLSTSQSCPASTDRSARWRPKAAFGVPLAVAATRRLGEIIQPGISGMTVPCGDPDSLAGAVSALLSDEPQAQRLAAEAKRMVRQARLREHVVRPGGRVDLVLYQALNPHREVPRA